MSFSWGNIQEITGNQNTSLSYHHSINHVHVHDSSTTIKRQQTHSTVYLPPPSCTHLAISLLHSEPLVGDELELLPCLHVAHHHEVEVPGGGSALPGVVVPDSEVAELTQRTRGRHDEAVCGGAAQDRTSRVGQGAYVGLVLLTGEDELDLAVALRVGLAARDDEDLV